MSAGFVYVLLNPSHPKDLKIGKTAGDPYDRARRLSGTSVPRAFVVLFAELVSDCKAVEAILHERFDSYRVTRRREFFTIPPTDAIRALIEVARRYPVSADERRLEINLLPYFRDRFSAYLNPLIVGLRFVQLPGRHCMEIDSRKGKDSSDVTTITVEVLLSGLEAPDVPTDAVLGANEKLLRACDEYDWINLVDIFTPTAAAEIAIEWTRPGGKLHQLLQEAERASALIRADEPPADQ